MIPLVSTEAEIKIMKDLVIRIAKKVESEEKPSTRKFFLWISLVINLGFLMVFKYLNFFIGSASELISMFGMQPNFSTLNIILPEGISFYTFQTLSYTFDVYYKKRPAESSIVDFFAYVSFFPQLVAGPIERSTHLLPQFKKDRVFDLSLAYSGLRQMLWGYVKKIVIADQMALYVNDIFQNYGDYSSSTLVAGSFLNAPNIIAVVISDSCSLTPLCVIQWCSALTTTARCSVFAYFFNSSAICVVISSCICGLSTM